MNHLFTLGLMLINLFLVSAASAQTSCTPIDLRSPTLGKVKQQGSLGWCFAYSTSDLLTHRLKVPVSALNLGINFYDKMPEMPRGDSLTRAAGGSDMGAMTYAKGVYCKEEALPSSEVVISKECQTGYLFSASNVLAEIEKILDKNKISLSKCDYQHIQTIFKKLSITEIDSINQSPRSTLEKFSRLRALNCKDSNVISEKKLAMRSGMESGAKVLKEIDQQLEKNNLISLNYDADFLVQKSNKAEVYNHYSTIVGRRENVVSGRCQYLIRNSWGEDCTVYPSPYDVMCEAGNIWVDSDVLLSSIISIHYLR